MLRGLPIKRRTTDLTLFEEFFKEREFIWKPELERIRSAVNSLGKKDYPSIIVGGTNGKGSTSHLAAEALLKNGLKVGLFSSPHLFRFTERIKVNLKEVPQSKVDEAFLRIKPTVEEFNLTYFEASLILALEIFKTESVDVAVFEVGLGGRLDATNALKHDVAVLTNVSIDHRNYLGSTLKEIAGEKAEIFRNAKFGVIGTEDETVVETVGKLFNGELHLYGRDFWADGISVSLKGTEFFYMGSLPIKVSPIGEFQAVNASVAIRASQILTEKVMRKRFLVPRELKMKLPGRFQVLKEEPPVIFDVAHNEGALSKLFKTAVKLKVLGDVYFSSLKDKEIDKNLKAVSEYLKVSRGNLFLLEIENERGAPIKTLLKQAEKLGMKPKVLKGKIDVRKIERPAIITGSFYLGGLIEGA